jgi:hypothetical protein
MSVCYQEKHIVNATPAVIIPETFSYRSTFLLLLPYYWLTISLLLLRLCYGVYKGYIGNIYGVSIVYP